jgi:hypothetical protein
MGDYHSEPMTIASYLLYHSEPMTIASYLLYHGEPMTIARNLRLGGVSLTWYMDRRTDIKDENTDNFLAILFREKVRPVKILNSSFSISK